MNRKDRRASERTKGAPVEPVAAASRCQAAIEASKSPPVSQAHRAGVAVLRSFYNERGELLRAD